MKDFSDLTLNRSVVCRRYDGSSRTPNTTHAYSRAHFMNRSFLKTNCILGFGVDCALYMRSLAPWEAARAGGSTRLVTSADHCTGEAYYNVTTMVVYDHSSYTVSQSRLFKQALLSFPIQRIVEVHNQLMQHFDKMIFLIPFGRTEFAVDTEQPLEPVSVAPVEPQMAQAQQVREEETTSRPRGPKKITFAFGIWETNMNVDAEVREQELVRAACDLLRCQGTVDFGRNGTHTTECDSFWDTKGEGRIVTHRSEARGVYPSVTVAGMPVSQLRCSADYIVDCMSSVLRYRAGEDLMTVCRCTRISDIVVWPAWYCNGSYTELP